MKLSWTKTTKHTGQHYWHRVHKWHTIVGAADYVVQMDDIVTGGWRVSLYSVRHGQGLADFLIEEQRATYNMAQHRARIIRDDLLTIIMEATL